MDPIVKEFFEREKDADVRLEVLPNGTRYLSEKCVKFNRLHEWFRPLSEAQIDELQRDVNAAQRASYVFPAWYRNFLQTTNGCNLYFGSLSLYGAQSPTVVTESGSMKELLERDDPGWMAPYDLCFSGSAKFDPAAGARWLTLGSYGYDGTMVVWDFKTEKIAAMYKLPVTMSVKALKAMKEADYEKMICGQWDSFDAFFMQETERLRAAVSQYGVDKEKGFLHRGKALPIGHKDRDALE